MRAVCNRARGPAPPSPPNVGGAWGGRARRRLPPTAGTLLLEVIAVTGVGAVVAALGVHLFVGLMRHTEVQQRRAALTSQARAVRHALLSDVRRSTGIAGSAGGYRSGSSTLALNLPETAEARQVVYRLGPQGIERILVGRRRETRLPDRQVLGDDLQTLSFETRPAGGHTLVEAQMGGSLTVRRRRLEVSLSCGAATRGGMP